MRARVIANFGTTLTVKTDDQHLLRCNNRRKHGLVVCGDWIEIELQNENTHIAVVTSITDRTSALARPDRKQQLKPLAANFDQLIIVTAPKPEPDRRLIDAYLVYAAHINVEAVIAINKSDLIDTFDKREWFNEIQSCYESLGYTVIYNCCKTPDGSDRLSKQFTGHTSILVGQSGVGKSSILKTLLPQKDIQTEVISKISGLGKHTTTTTILYELPQQGELIDSPGVREFSVGHLETDIIRAGFIEFRNLENDCKFNNCSHIHEPGCAVLKAVEKGTINPGRWESYKILIDSYQQPAY